MKIHRAAPIAAVGLVALAFGTASAGLVMTRTEQVVSGNIGPKEEARQTTTMIQGHKERLVSGMRAVIVDLDKSTIDVLDPSKKSYLEMPFPPKGMMAQSIGGPAMRVSDFTKAGNSRTVAGFSCDDYKGSGQLPMGKFNTTYCVSTKAPGAAEFTEFQKTMVAKLKAEQPTIAGKMPDGIPLAEDTTTQMVFTNFGNMPPAMVEKLKAQLANRPPIVTKSEVTKVEEKSIDPSEFVIPADYTKREPMMGRMGAMPRPLQLDNGAQAPGPAHGGGSSGNGGFSLGAAAGSVAGGNAGGASSSGSSGGAPPSGPSSSLNQ